MDKKKRHINLSLKKYLKYFKNSLSNEEKNAFEKKVMQDLFDEEAYEGLSTVSPDDLKNDLKDLEIILQSKTSESKNKRNLPLIYMRYAAIFALLIGVGTIMYFLFQTAEKSNQIADTVVKDQDSNIIVEEKSPISKGLKEEVKKEEKEKTTEIKRSKAVIKQYTSTEKEFAAAEEEIVDTFGLEEIAVVGYSKMEKEDITGAVSAVKEEEMVSVDLDEALQGKAAGGVVEKSKKRAIIMGQKTSSDENIQIRGLSSIDQSSNPLIIVDGDIFYGDINSLNPDEIERIEVLKEPSETAIYGARGVNGVILITSKELDSSDIMRPVVAMEEIKTKSTGQAPTIISGRVINEFDNEPLPGVNVIIKGSTLGTVTDIDGNFTLEVIPDENQILNFNYIGYTPEEVEISDNQEINVILKEDILALDEVVVVGYGSTKKSELTGAISRIETDEKENEYSFIPPEPIDGMKDYKDYITENIQYDELPEIENNITVKLKFVVEANGTISNISVMKSQGEIFDNEAIRLIQEGPSWKPALENDKPVAKKVSLKIKFEAR